MSEYPNKQLVNGRWVPAKPLRMDGWFGFKQRWKCEHDWWPEGFADWYCPKCGKER